MIKSMRLLKPAPLCWDFSYSLRPPLCTLVCKTLVHWFKFSRGIVRPARLTWTSNIVEVKSKKNHVERSFKRLHWIVCKLNLSGFDQWKRFDPVFRFGRSDKTVTCTRIALRACAPESVWFLALWTRHCVFCALRMLSCAGVWGLCLSPVPFNGFVAQRGC